MSDHLRPKHYDYQNGNVKYHMEYFSFHADTLKWILNHLGICVYEYIWNKTF